MKLIKRYKNGSLYEAASKSFVNFEVLRNTEYRVMENGVDVTDEVRLLIEIDYVIKHKLFKQAKVVIDEST